MKTKVTDVQASGILDSTTYLRGDGQWATPAGGTSNYVVVNREVVPYTGADETYTIPAGIIRLRIHAWGGGGQGGQYGGGAAGAGGYTVAEISVTPGDTLELQVGQGGQWTGFSTQNPGGWPDGGDGSYGDTSGGGGGGSTRVFNSLNDLLLIAGAGAGAAGYIGTGGVGGGTTGGSASGGGATGGSQSAGGTSGGGGDPGTGPVDYASRATQRGGNGGPTGSTATDGGGGGGGYYGGAGGGGDGKAGGGGSGFFDPALVQEGNTISGIGTVPPAISVTGYVGGVGVGSTSGSGLDGGDGLIVIEEMIEGIDLAGLYDVDIPSPADGQVLTFNAATEKWEAVDPTGGGGGGGQPWWFQPPVVADFTTAFGGAHGWATLADNADEGLLFDAGTPLTGDSTIYAYKTITSPSTDWVATIRCTPTIPNQNYSAFGLLVQNSANSRIQMIALANGLGAWTIKDLQLNPASYNSETAAVWQGNPQWLRLAKVGTNLLSYVSSDGKSWALFNTYAIGSWLAADPDRVGFGVLYNRGSGSNVVGAIQYWNFQ